jgi:hypothetical protein
VILPKSIIEKTGIKPEEKVVIEIKKIHKAKEFFGLLKGWKRDTQEIKEKLRKGW